MPRPSSELPEEVELSLSLDEPEDPEHLAGLVARRLGLSPEQLPPLHIRRRAFDARRGRVSLRLRVALGATPPPVGPAPREVTRPQDVLVVGDGPAGLFCAWELARHGVGCTVLERGKRVQPRRHDLKSLNREGLVDPDSNYCFGEGGAGTYSDGKLYTRASKRGDVQDVLQTLVLNGAPEDILVDARPHIGSNRLPVVVSNLRERLEAVGVGFEFGARVTGLLVEGQGTSRRVAGVRLAGGMELAARAVVLATGHSARDVFELLAELGLPLEPKPFAVGVRIEHPQPLIDRIQYGRDFRHPKLPAAAYTLTTQVDGRGVFSFCMCPGGFIVPAATSPGELVVNGMSLKRRDSPFANSGLVVELSREDLARAGDQGPLAGVSFQRRLERAAFAAGGGALRAPATRVEDFLAGRASTTVPATSYQPGATATDLGVVLDAGLQGLAGRLRQGIQQLDRVMRRFASEALLLGVESRTSCPVRVPRDPDTLQALGLLGLYPSGEGAGYAGGIVSAALDGIRVAKALLSGLG